MCSDVQYILLKRLVKNKAKKNSNGGTGKTKNVVIKLSVELFVISGHSVFIVLNHRISFFLNHTVKLKSKFKRNLQNIFIFFKRAFELPVFSKQYILFEF